MTLLDTNVLIYASDASAEHHSWANDIITDAVDSTGAGLNPVGLAELCEVDPIVWTDFPVRITTIPSR